MIRTVYSLVVTGVLLLVIVAFLSMFGPFEPLPAGQRLAWQIIFSGLGIACFVSAAAMVMLARRA